jgi:hypothetical protein
MTETSVNNTNALVTLLALIVLVSLLANLILSHALYRKNLKNLSGVDFKR